MTANFATYLRDNSQPAASVGHFLAEHLQTAGASFSVVSAYFFRNNSPGKKDDDGHLVRKSRYHLYFISAGKGAALRQLRHEMDT